MLNYGRIKDDCHHQERFYNKVRHTAPKRACGGAAFNNSIRKRIPRRKRPARAGCYSYIWLIWGFSEVKAERWSPMVKPPRLGGNKRMGVFATRSPYRPNPIGLSSVKLEGIEKRPNLGTVLIVSGADLMDGTPIYDIKPYLSFTDSHPDAKNGFAGERLSYALKVEIPDELMAMIPQSKRDALTESLSQDPRPAYLTEPDTPFGFEYAGFDVRFKVNGDTLTVYEIIRL